MSSITATDFYRKYGDVKVTFSSYYKFMFTFEGKTPQGKKIKFMVGGISDDIYRFEVTTEPVLVRSLVEVECFYLPSDDGVGNSWSVIY